MCTCESNLFFSEDIYVGSSPGEGDTDFILEGFGYTLKEGKTLANVVAAEVIFTALFAPMKSKVNVPVDLVYLIVHDDLMAFASYNTSITTSEAGTAAQNGLFQIMDCNGGLYSGNVVHVPQV